MLSGLREMDSKDPREAMNALTKCTSCEYKTDKNFTKLKHSVKAVMALRRDWVEWWR
jgi:hypothetical protein